MSPLKKGLVKTGEKVMKREEYLRLYYKWEFLRRNAEYVKIYRNLKEARLRFDINKFAEDIKVVNSYEQMTSRFHFDAQIRFGISMIIDPERNFPAWKDFTQALEAKKGSPKKLTKQMRRDLFSVMVFQMALKITPVSFLAYDNNNRILPIDLNGIPQVHSEEGRKIFDSGYVRVLIDMNAPARKILSSVSNAVSYFKENNSKKKSKKSFRCRPEQYDRYLRIYDLRMAKRRYREIAKIIFPREYKEISRTCMNRYDFASLVEKIKTSFNVSKEFVDGKYKEIT